MSGMIEETKAAEQINGAVGVAEPKLEYSEIPESGKPVPLPPEEPGFEAGIPVFYEETAYSPPKKSRKGVAALVVLIIFAGVGVAAYRFGFLRYITGFETLNIKEALDIKNVTELPEDAEAPVFTALDPAEFANAVNDELVVVPDETGLEPSPDNKNLESSIPSKNYYTQTPNVSEFYAGAAQDESYVYFLKNVPSGDNFSGSELWRMKVSNGKAEPVPNANEVSGSIYSFTLWEQNIITCEIKQDTQEYAFYRVPKAFEDAQLLFEQDSPAFMNVYDNKIFMLFTQSRKLGVYDPKTDKQPSFIDIGADNESSHYLPQFSVVNGYLYYGIWHAEEERTEYFRRSLYTGETAKMLDSGEYDSGAGSVQIWNPCWGDDGNGFYGQLELDKGTCHIVAHNGGGTSEVISTYITGGGNLPLIALKDGFLIAAAGPGALYRYNNRDGFLLEQDIAVTETPYAVTRDFLVAADGIYRISDFSFTSFNK